MKDRGTQIELTADDTARLDRIRAILGAKTSAEAVRRSLRVAELMLDHDGEIEMVDKDGVRTKIRFCY